jgi:hypothetical protein
MHAKEISRSNIRVLGFFLLAMGVVIVLAKTANAGGSGARQHGHKTSLSHSKQKFNMLSKFQIDKVSKNGRHEAKSVRHGIGVKRKQGGITKLIAENPQRAKPLIISAGQGTTSTHSVYNVLCSRGVKTIHWMRGGYSFVYDLLHPLICNMYRLQP